MVRGTSGKEGGGLVVRRGRGSSVKEEEGLVVRGRGNSVKGGGDS